MCRVYRNVPLSEGSWVVRSGRAVSTGLGGRMVEGHGGRRVRLSATGYIPPGSWTLGGWSGASSPVTESR